MVNKNVKWEILNKNNGQRSGDNVDNIIEILLENRGVVTRKEKEEFFNPKNPCDLSLKDLGVDQKQLEKAIERIKKAIKEDEEIIIYGDYDADGICATAILWETIYLLNKKVKPYIPDRFEEGYGLNAETISKLKSENSNLKLIITVDNGIVASKSVETANNLGIDVVVTDHHQKEKKLPKAYAIIHTDKISGSGVAWILARELKKHFKIQNSGLMNDGLELAAIGTIADQMPLVGANRSFAKYGLKALNKTKRPGLLALFAESGLSDFKGENLQGKDIGTYEINFVIAPRINAMGRLEHAIDSLRLLCTKNNQKARELANILGRTNKKRQKIVDEVILHASGVAQKRFWKGAIVLSHESYHEGVIGLAASKLVEEFRRPAIVLSVGKQISKASARSITGFNIIESIKKLDDLILGGGGHPMAAGFSIKTSKIELFRKKFEDLTALLLTDEVLTRKLKIDMDIEFVNLSYELVREIEKFEPTGIGNPTAVFKTVNTSVVDAKSVGKDGKHLKLTFEKNGFTYNAIAFGMGEYYLNLTSGCKVDIVYNLALDVWNGNKKIQLKIKDMKIKKINKSKSNTKKKN